MDKLPACCFWIPVSGHAHIADGEGRQQACVEKFEQQAYGQGIAFQTPSIYPVLSFAVGTWKGASNSVVCRTLTLPLHQDPSVEPKDEEMGRDGEFWRVAICGVAARRKDAGVQSKMPKAGSRWRFEQLLVVDGKADLKIAAILERNWLELAQSSDFSDFNDFSYIDQSLYLDVGYLWEKHVFQFMRLLWVLVVDFQA